MSVPQFAIVRLTAAHDRTNFASGDEPLDRFIKEQAMQAMRDRACAVFVATPVDDVARVIGYYTFSPATLPAGGVPEDLRARLPRYPELPAALLGRLAVHEAYGGKGLGSLLIANALRRTEAQRDLPVMFLVVDAYEQARNFYLNLGFAPVMNSQTRLFIALSRLSRGAHPGDVIQAASQSQSLADDAGAGGGKPPACTARKRDACLYGPFVLPSPHTWMM
jgi:GNAT superfamily N-acetyltransferase